MASVSQKEILRRTIDALEASLARHPGNEKIMHQLAVAFAQSGAFHPRALELYSIVSEKFPGDLKVQRAVSIGYLIQQAQEMVPDLRRIEDIDPDSMGRSIEKLKSLAREYPDSAEIHRALGDLQLLAREEREALQHYRIAIALGVADLEPLCRHYELVSIIVPLSPAVSVFFCDLYQRLGAYEKAQGLFKRLLMEHEGDPLVLDAYYGYLQRRMEQVAQDERALAVTVRELIRVTLQLDQTKEALTWARQLSPDALGEDPALVKELARVLIDMEDYRQAFDYLARLQLDQEVKTLLNEVSVRLEKRGEIDAAVYLLQYINNHDSVQPPPIKTEEEIRRARAEQRELDIQTELSLAELHWKNRRWVNAFERYLHVLELGYEDYRTILEPLDLLIDRLPDLDAAPLEFLTNFFAEKREWRRVLRYAERALAINPSLTNISQRLMQSCEQILLQDPDAADVRLRLGDLHLDKGNIERAMQEYRKAVSLPDYSMKANRRLAIASIKAGDLLGAFEKYRTLPVLDAEDLERLYDLLIQFSYQQSYKEAIEVGQLILEYDAKFRDVQDKLRVLEAKAKAAGSEFAIDQKMRELIGDHAIGRYRYIGKVGSGGMGIVHKVMDLKTNQQVAMKILREGLSNSGRAIDRFFREARIASTLRHKNIVAILDYNISNVHGQSYIAMEFVDGPSMREVIEKKYANTVELGTADVLEALDWMSQLCDALDVTHRKGIIHRDIKPDNVMLAPGNQVKITDFGIVHIEEATFTPAGALIGTPRYMSPEQVHGGRIDGRSDLYSVGIIFYELLIGSPPFISGDIAYQQVNVLPTRPIEINPSIPSQVDRVIMKCLEKNANDRYQSALELKRDLDEAYIRLGGDPEKRRSPSSHTTVGVGLAPTVAVPAPLQRGPLKREETKDGDTLDNELDLGSSSSVPKMPGRGLDDELDFH